MARHRAPNMFDQCYDLFGPIFFRWCIIACLFLYVTTSHL